MIARRYALEIILRSSKRDLMDVARNTNTGPSNLSAQDVATVRFELITALYSDTRCDHIVSAVEALNT